MKDSRASFAKILIQDSRKECKYPVASSMKWTINNSFTQIGQGNNVFKAQSSRVSPRQFQFRTGTKLNHQRQQS